MPAALVRVYRAVPTFALSCLPSSNTTAFQTTPFRSRTFRRASTGNAYAKTTSSSGTVCLPSSIFAIVPSRVIRVVGFPLMDQPRLDESAEDPFSRHGRLHP